MIQNDKRKAKKEQKILADERARYHKAMLAKAKQERFTQKKVDKSAYISLTNINKIYPNHVQAVYDFNLSIKEKEFIVFVGPSGCGKSTTLRMIAGLEDITYGDLFIDGVYANELPPKSRNVGVVFQSYALYPHMSVYDNLAFGLQINHVPASEIKERVLKTAEVLELSEYLDRKPSELSGGQCQRVALGRAIIKECKVFLMDEPLSNLDAKLRVQMRSEIVKLHNSLNATTIYVTHDQTEAMSMASRIVVMNKGYIQQIGTPSEIYNKPQNVFVASFIGSPAMNFIHVKEDDNSLVFSNNKVALPKNFKKIKEEFYTNEIARLEKEIVTWKNEFAERYLATRLGQKMLISIDALSCAKDEIKAISAIDKSLDKVAANLKEEVLAKYQQQFDQLRASLSSLNADGVDGYKEQFVAFLKEAIYEENSIDNPLIIKLNEDYVATKELIANNNPTYILGIRPEDIKLTSDKSKKTIGKYSFQVTLLELVGNQYFVHVDIGEKKDLILAIDADNKLASGDKIECGFDQAKIHVFDTISKKALI